MGCDIHICAEKRRKDGTWFRVRKDRIGQKRTFRNGFSYFRIALDDRNYNVFALLAGVRNYENIDAIAEARGIPDNASESTFVAFARWGNDAHSTSWVSLEELTSHPYTSELREQLGIQYFDDLELLQIAGVERIIFWFDN